MPGFLSSRPNWFPHRPHPQASVAPHLLGPGGRRTCLRGMGWGDQIWTTIARNSGALYTMYNPFMGKSSRDRKCIGTGGGDQGMNIQGADDKLGQFLSQDIYATANHRNCLQHSLESCLSLLLDNVKKSSLTTIYVNRVRNFCSCI